jgi:hypothetical protein
MSFFPKTTPAVIEVTHTVAPTASNIIFAGTTQEAAPTVASPSRLSSVRAHLASNAIASVHAFTQVVPTPMALGLKPSTVQLEAAQELSHFAADLCAPIECARGGNGTFESSTAFSDTISVEQMVQNMREYSLCLKTTISSVNPHFTPSVYMIDANDLSRLSACEGIQQGGMLSKFIHAECDSVPHHILLHITQKNVGAPHRFYGIAYVESDSFESKPKWSF